MDTYVSKNQVDGQASDNMEAWLVSEHILTSSQANLAQREANRLGLSFGKIVQKLGLVTSEEISRFRSVRGKLRTATEFIQEGQIDGQSLSLRRLSLDDSLRAKISPDLCEKLIAIPVAERDGCIWIACANPFDLPTIKRLETATKQPIEILPAS